MAGFGKQCGKSFSAFINKFKWIILGIWFVSLVGSAFFCLKFIDRLSIAYDPPAGSGAALYADQYNVLFPASEKQTTVPIVALVSKKDSMDETDSILQPDVEKFSKDLYDLVAKYNVTGYGPMLHQYASYYTIPDFKIGGVNIRDQLLSANKTSTLINMDMKTFTFGDINDFLDYLIEEFEVIIPQNATFTVDLTGLSVFFHDMKDGVESDLTSMDAITLPVAMLILMIMLRSVKVMLIPIMNILSIVVYSFLLMWPMSIYSSVASFTPSVMMSLTIALSVDYALFMLSRFREERFKGKPVIKCVENMMQFAAHNVCVSGCTIFVCFIGLCFAPLQTLSSLGSGAGVTIICTILVNCIMTPVWIFCFPNFFKTFWGMKQGKLDDVMDAPIFETADEEEEHDVPTDVASPFYTALVKYTLQYKYMVVIVIVAATLPVVPYAIPVRSDVFSDMVPRQSTSYNGFKTLTEEFGAGVAEPFNLLISINENIMTQEFFQQANDLVKEICTRAGDVDPSTDTLGVIKLPFKAVKNSIDPKYATNKFLAPFKSIYDQYVSPFGNATFVDIRLPYDPLSEKGELWLVKVREVIANITEERKNDEDWVKRDTKLFLGGTGPTTYDAIQAVYNYFPYLVVSTCGIVLVLVAVAFQSIVVSIRAVFTISITLVLVYGAATGTYVYGMLSWTGLGGLSQLGAVSWSCPVISFSILVGLGLDYDIFLLSRIAEYRDAGLSINECIIHGVDKTGSIITAAGLIMAVAFSGLLMSSVGVLNQTSFFLVFSVLLDTFLIRMVMVPALMGILGKWNWWPYKLHVNVKDEDTFNDYNTLDA